MDHQFPPVPLQLLEALEAQFPNQVPELSDTERQIWAKVGNQQVLRFMRRQFEERAENLLDTKVV